MYNITPYVAFDIETVEPAPNDYSSYDLGITCAATYTNDGSLKIWHGKEQPDGRYADRMDEDDIFALVQELCRDQIPVSFNGLGFDFRVIHEAVESPSTKKIVRHLAIHHIDMAFNMLCDKGYMIGLAAMAEGLGLPGKTEGMDGLRAIDMWKGTRAEQSLVLEYVGQDARATAYAYEALVQQGQVYWTTKKGARARYPWEPRFVEKSFDQTTRLQLVVEANDTPEPDTSWMTSPLPRSKFIEWTNL